MVRDFDTSDGIFFEPLALSQGAVACWCSCSPPCAPPILPFIVALVFAAPAAMAGYMLVHGATRESVPSEIWRQIFCISRRCFHEGPGGFYCSQL